MRPPARPTGSSRSPARVHRHRRPRDTRCRKGDLRVPPQLRPQFREPLPRPQLQVNQPTGLSVDLAVNILFADTGNHLVRAHVPSTTHVFDDLDGVVTGGGPQGGYTPDGSPANHTLLQLPQAVAASAVGPVIVVADTGNASAGSSGARAPHHHSRARPGDRQPGRHRRRHRPVAAARPGPAPVSPQRKPRTPPRHLPTGVPGRPPGMTPVERALSSDK